MDEIKQVKMFSWMRCFAIVGLGLAQHSFVLMVVRGGRDCYAASMGSCNLSTVKVLLLCGIDVRN